MSHPGRNSKNKNPGTFRLRSIRDSRSRIPKIRTGRCGPSNGIAKPEKHRGDGRTRPEKDRPRLIPQTYVAYAPRRNRTTRSTCVAAVPQKIRRRNSCPNHARSGTAIPLPAPDKDTIRPRLIVDLARHDLIVSTLPWTTPARTPADSAQGPRRSANCAAVGFPARRESTSLSAAKRPCL